MLRTAVLFVLVAIFLSLPFTSPNLSSSFSSLTNAFTVRIALTSSSTVPLSLSTVDWSTEYIGATWRTIEKSTIPSIGTMMMKTTASSAFIEKEKITPRTSITGALTSGLRPLFIVFCITVISLVMRVTSELVSNLSMFENAYLCSFSYSLSLILAPQP